MSKLSKILDPISSLVRTVREVSKPSADRMRRRARRLDFRADKAMARYVSARTHRSAQRALKRSLGLRLRAIRLRQDADLIAAKESAGDGR